MARRRIATSGVGPQRKAALAVPLVFRHERLATISGQYSDGSVVAELPVGPYTYKNQQIMIVLNAQTDDPDNAGVSMTYEVNGTHYLKSSFFTKFVKKISLEIDGDVVRDVTAARSMQMNGHYGYDVVDGFHWMTFGGPREFWDQGAEDAYLLGTGDLRDLRLNFDLTSDWVTGSMKIQIMSEYARIARPIAYLTTLKSFRYTFAAAGPVVITDVPVNADLAQLFAFGTGIKHAKLEVDSQFIFDGDYQQLMALNALYGRDVSALGDCVLFDFWREKNASKGLKALNADPQIKRNADIRIHLDLEAATEVEIVARACGIYRSQG
ncbi:MAG: hypothetical protein GQ535_11125 [Rhodobacteraceae bacterium]|nr:hypothetical protein [Paracoccaceae bacterium]